MIRLSDGARGSTNLVMRHPSVYGAVGAHSGVYLLKADWSSAPLFGLEPGANRAFHARLDSLHSAIEFHVYPGSHDWSYCRTHPE